MQYLIVYMDITKIKTHKSTLFWNIKNVVYSKVLISENHIRQFKELKSFNIEGIRLEVHYFKI